MRLVYRVPLAMSASVTLNPLNQSIVLTTGATNALSVHIVLLVLSNQLVARRAISEIR